MSPYLRNCFRSTRSLNATPSGRSRGTRKRTANGSPAAALRSLSAFGSSRMPGLHSQGVPSVRSSRVPVSWVKSRYATPSASSDSAA